MKKAFCLLLALLMIATTLTGCFNGGKEESSFPDSESETQSVIDPADKESSREESSDSAEESEKPSAPVTEIDPEVKKVLKLSAEQRNSVEMLFYLSMVSRQIESHKTNRLYLEEVYSSLMNDLDPASVDIKTKDHLETIQSIIKGYRQIELKRERLQSIYEKEKAATIKSALPNPLAVLSLSQSADWKGLVSAVLFAAATSFANYKNTNDSLDKQFVMSGWELDDEETEQIHRNRTRAFNYMVDIVREYQLRGDLALPENFVDKFVTETNNQNINQKLQFLKSNKEIYAAFGPYWLEMAKCYFELKDYGSVLTCLANYEAIGSGIFRYDNQYAEILPMAIVAAQSIYANNKDQLVSRIEKYANTLNSPYQTKWELRYFAAQSYLFLYSKTKKTEYLQKAYDIAINNVNSLVKKQEEINATYLADVRELALSDAEKKSMSKDEEKAQQKELDWLNKSLKEKRKTELPELYEPLIVNCELLFSLANDYADVLEITNETKNSIAGILSDAFIVDPIAEKFSFGKKDKGAIEVLENEIIIPANLLSASAEITAVISTSNGSETVSDFSIAKVERKGAEISSFKAHYESKKMKSTKWEVGDTVTIKIKNREDLIDEWVFKVTEIKEGVWDWVKGVLGSDKAVFECIE